MARLFLLVALSFSAGADVAEGARRFVRDAVQYLQVGTPIVTAYPFTVSLWFKTNRSDVNQCLWFTGDTGGSTNQEWVFYLSTATSTTDFVAFYVKASGAAQIATTTKPFRVGQWHHAVAVGESATSRLVYIDGGGKGTNTASATPTGLDETSIGVRHSVSPSTNTDLFDGEIVDVAMWNVALTDSEVFALAKGYASPLSIRRASLIDYWPMLNGGGSVSDVIGSNTLTDTGGTGVTSEVQVNPWQSMLYRAKHISGATVASGGIIVNTMRGGMKDLTGGMR